MSEMPDPNRTNKKLSHELLNRRQARMEQAKARWGAELYKEAQKKAAVAFWVFFVLTLIANYQNSDQSSSDPIEVLLGSLFVGGLASGIVMWLFLAIKDPRRKQ
jgi:hypothetical protein